MTTVKSFKAKPPPKPCPGFKPEAAQGTDWRGWQFCGTCRHFGDPADKRDLRHPPPGTTPAPPPTGPRSRRARQIAAIAAEIEARRLGEHDPTDTE